MATVQGSYGKLKVFEDFLGIGAPTGGTTAGVPLGQVVQYADVAPTISKVVDEEGGVLSLVTAATDNECNLLMAGTFKPSLGGCFIEARIKCGSISTGAIWVGFSETASTTVVVPCAISGTTLTCQGSGGMVAALYDPDQTTDVWYAVAGDGGVEETIYPSTTALVADYWALLRVEINDDGDGTVYVDGVKIHTFEDCVTPTDQMHACVYMETRAATATTFEIDYIAAGGGRDWTTS